MSNNAFFALISSDEYLNGFRLLNESFQLLNSKYPLNVMITSDCSTGTHYKLEKYASNFDNVIVRKIKADNFFVNSSLKYYKTTFNKFQMLRFKEYDKICYVDSDFILLKNLDFIFDLDDKIYLNMDDSSNSGIIDVVTGKKTDLRETVSKEDFEIISQEYGENYFNGNLKVLGGIFMMNTKYYDYDSIKKKYQQKAFPTDEFVIYDLLSKSDPEKFNYLKSDKNVFKKFHTLLKDMDNAELHYIHFKFWKEFFFNRLSEKRQKELVIKLSTDRDFKNDVVEFLFCFSRKISFATYRKIDKKHIFSKDFRKLLIEIMSLTKKDMEIHYETILNLYLAYDNLFTDEEITEIENILFS